MENVVAWIAEAEPAEALPKLGAAFNTTFADTAALQMHLDVHKTYLPLHESAAEVLAGIAECRARTSELLNDIADVARAATGSRKHVVPWPQQSTPMTNVWRLQP
jgi:hypothetical protein